MIFCSIFAISSLLLCSFKHCLSCIGLKRKMQTDCSAINKFDGDLHLLLSIANMRLGRRSVLFNGTPFSVSAKINGPLRNVNCTRTYTVMRLMRYILDCTFTASILNVDIQMAPIERSLPYRLMHLHMRGLCSRSTGSFHATLASVTVVDSQGNIRGEEDLQNLLDGHENLCIQSCQRTLLNLLLSGLNKARKLSHTDEDNSLILQCA
nr:unnamed protein product [Spirometra erinaceieuropaei]